MATDQPATGTLQDRCWRLLFRCGYPVARLWWRVARPRHSGALVAVRVGRRVLLLRASYRREWNFPGGTIRRRETPEAAAHRELAEETGLTGQNLRPAGSLSGVWDGRRDRIHFFELTLAAPPPLRLDNREIVDARLAAPEEWRGIALTVPVAAYLSRATEPTAEET